MKRIISLLKICMLAGMICLCGCQMSKTPEETGKEVPYTVAESDEIPKELKDVIAKNRQDEIRMSYVDGGYLYAVRGYGEQKTGGYSIQVNGVWEKEDGIHVDTSLLGPSPDKEIKEEPSYPYLVLKLEQREEPVVFD